MELVKLTDTELTLQLQWSDFWAISPNIAEPDYLLVIFKLPELFIDAETGQPMGDEELEFGVPVGAQFS